MSFGTDDAAIAALVISLFPRLPDTTTDQRSHLQPFRHLYALAARSRLLKVRQCRRQHPGSAMANSRPPQLRLCGMREGSRTDWV